MLETYPRHKATCRLIVIADVAMAMKSDEHYYWLEKIGKSRRRLVKSIWMV